MTRARFLSRISEVDAGAWNALAGPDNPFVQHAFLRALETTGCATRAQGWTPRHAVLEDAAGRLVAAAPAYFKAHSWGEFVFDHAWAQAAARLGVAYYPKLQVAVPFTPVTGPRLLVAPGPDAGALRAALAATLVDEARRAGLSSVHATFLDAADRDALETAGWLLRCDLQFHWDNPGYASFAEFLGSLVSRKRKQVRKERDAVARTGIQVLRVRGDVATPAQWGDFHACYATTAEDKMGHAYLTLPFHLELGRVLGERVLLVLAYRGTTCIAGAINLEGRDTLYGRNWGAREEVPFLHFEVCYYQAIEHAIERGLKRVEAGAQGPHKLARGYLPTRTWSAHAVFDPALHDALRVALPAEVSRVGGIQARTLRASPYATRDEGDHG